MVKQKDESVCLKGKAKMMHLVHFACLNFDESERFSTALRALLWIGDQCGYNNRSVNVIQGYIILILISY